MSKTTPAQPPRCAVPVDVFTGQPLGTDYDALTPAQRYGLTRERHAELLRGQESAVWVRP